MTRSSLRACGSAKSYIVFRIYQIQTRNNPSR